MMQRDDVRSGVRFLVMSRPGHGTDGKKKKKNREACLALSSCRRMGCALYRHCCKIKKKRRKSSMIFTF